MPLSHRQIWLVVMLWSALTGLAGSEPLRTARIFSSHMVLQRQMEVPVWGWYDPGQTIRLEFADQKHQARSDNTGRWEILLKPMPAGGPWQMRIESEDACLILEDILVGDVWICSGQSNMWRPVSTVINAESEIRSASYPEMRIFKYPRTLTAKPQEDILLPHPDEARLTPMEWELCTPETVPEFSAVAYFFGRELYEHLGVPVGLIRSCWGSTRIEPWMSVEALERIPEYTAIRHQLVDPVRILDSVTRAYRGRIDDHPGSDAGMQDQRVPWYKTELQDEGWEEMYLPVSLEEGGLNDYDGTVWFRREFLLPEDCIHDPFLLSLGTILDASQVWVNGHAVGEQRGRIPGSPYYGNQPPSTFHITPGLLQSGRNQLTVRLVNYTGRGGILGDDGLLLLESGNHRLLLNGKWKFHPGFRSETPPPKRVRPHQYPTVCFNGMIHPLIPLAIKGVIWYQGESNTGHPAAYLDLFRGLMRDWRQRWGQGDFPFLFVQLANFGKPDKEPGNDNWALLREAQYKALSEPATGMAVTIDIGESDDIHPANKQDVGRRLALTARKVAYGEAIVHSGPVFKSMKTEGSVVRLCFGHTGSGLVIKDKYGYVRGFALAGRDRQWHWARGLLDGDTLVIRSPNVREPVAVRYAWSKNPGALNLYNKEDLPAVPFRTDHW